MGDNDECDPFFFEFFDTFDKFFFSFCIKVGVGFIKEDEGRVTIECTCEGDTLFLSP